MSQALRDNAAYHSRLISTISELDYVPSALKLQTSYVDDLQTRLEESQALLRKLSEATKKERKEHESLRDSTTRRLAHKLTGRKDQFQAMATKEEREYVEALEKEYAERDTYNLLVTMNEEAKREKADLADKAIRYEALKKELSDLYMLVFDGPTEEYPEDDRLEYQVQSTQALHEQIQDTLNAECPQVKEALAHSQRDMWGGSRLNTVWDRNALSLAQALARQADSLCQQARNVSPFVELIGPLKIAQGSLVRDIFFSPDVISETEYHNKIASTASDLQQAHDRLRAERDAAQRRANNAGNQLIEVADALETERLALASYRREIFLGISREEDHPSSPDQPPGYYAASAQLEASAATEAPPPQEPAELPNPVITSPQPTSSTSSSPSRWGSRNPYAANLAIRSLLPS
ncbi:hypothetical protein H2248_002814 [Termitomyces sp. 'cryptogamus']|nr:hypothetical protein H2248_002814 [Termitomyces sp. 'cryptogamus']